MKQKNQSCLAKLQVLLLSVSTVFVAMGRGYTTMPAFGCIMNSVEVDNLETLLAFSVNMTNDQYLPSVFFLAFIYPIWLKQKLGGPN